METATWKKFVSAKEHFRQIVKETDLSLPGLKKIQQAFADSRPEASYQVQTPVVYNYSLDDIEKNDTIKLILVADNPGRREQAQENRRYLVGPSGKIAKKFFADNIELGIDFLRNVIILNKTPVHTPRTGDLKKICAGNFASDGGSINFSAISEALKDSQIKMADLLFQFQQALCCPVWITGYSEMKKGGIFEAYTQRLKELYANNKEMYKQVFIYRHFSMNQFTIDLKHQSMQNEKTASCLKRIGKAYRERILG